MKSKPTITLVSIIQALLFAWVFVMPSNVAAQSAGVSSMHVVILGDSNSSIGGDDCSNPIAWTKWFADALQPATCVSYARSGATWTNTPRTIRNVDENIGVLGDNNVVYNQICRLAEAVGQGRQPKPDVIVIAAGTNDAWFQKSRPYVFHSTAKEAFVNNKTFITSRKPSSVVTLAESVRYACELLMQHYPEARIVLLTPMQTTKATFDDIERVGNIIEACGHRMSIPVIRQDHISGIYSISENQHPRFTSDGTHTSLQGARRNGRLLARQIRSLLFVDEF